MPTESKKSEKSEKFEKCLNVTGAILGIVVSILDVVVMFVSKKRKHKIPKDSEPYVDVSENMNTSRDMDPPETMNEPCDTTLSSHDLDLLSPSHSSSEEGKAYSLVPHNSI